jgi:hypothetical protein
MRHPLVIHPGSSCPAVARIDVAVDRIAARRLVLTYVLTADLSEVRVPGAAKPKRKDGLWRRTCFEAFIAGGGESYTEFNFSPSGEWAAYAFSTYRAGMALADVSAPVIDFAAGVDRCELRAELDLTEDGTRRLGLSAVIEDASGGISYWALAHPPGRPDFHQAATFVLDLDLPVPEPS